MKVKKWAVLLLALVMAFAFGIFAGAEALPEENETIPEGDALPEDVTNGVEETAKAENDTVLGRLWEYLESHYPVILIALSDIGILFVAWCDKNKHKILVSGLHKTVSGQAKVTEAAGRSTEATEKMLSAQNTFSDRLAVLEKSEEERDRVSSAVLYDMTMLLQMIYSLTMNNANIPQPIKDYTTAIYAKCISKTEGSTDLAEVYKKMRGILGLEEREGAADEEEKAY